MLFILLLLYAVVSVELYLNKYLIVFNESCPILSDGQPALLKGPHLPKKQKRFAKLSFTQVYLPNSCPHGALSDYFSPVFLAAPAVELAGEPI